MRDLLRNALRMRPDRIIIGEVRGPEALDLLQALNTGHRGSITTIHANSPFDALSRLETMSLTAGIGLPSRAIREQIACAVDILVHLERVSTGKRVVGDISVMNRRGGGEPRLLPALGGDETGAPIHPAARGLVASLAGHAFPEREVKAAGSGVSPW